MYQEGDDSYGDDLYVRACTTSILLTYKHFIRIYVGS